MNCPKCNSPVIPGSKFCGSCGNTLIEAVENAAPNQAASENLSGNNPIQSQSNQKNKSYKTWIVVAIVGIAAYAYISFTGQLSEGKAADLISKKFNLPAPISYPVQHGLIRFSNYDSYNLNLYNALAEKHILTITNMGSQGYYNNNYQIDITSEGDKYKIKDSSDYESRSFHILKGGQMVLGGITEIVKSENGKKADVSFTWGYAEVTPVGEIMGMMKSKTDQFKSSITFEKYDDGWRIKEGFNLNDLWDGLNDQLNNLYNRR